jgi:hypothetical protein
MDNYTPSTHYIRNAYAVYRADENYETASDDWYAAVSQAEDEFDRWFVRVPK